MSNIIKVYRKKYLLSRWYTCVPTSNNDLPIQEVLRGVFPGEMDKVCYDISNNRSLLVLMKGQVGVDYSDDPPMKVRTAVDLVELLFAEHCFQNIEHQLWICIHANHAELLHMVAGVVKDVHYEQFDTKEELNRKIFDFANEIGLTHKTTILPMGKDVLLSDHLFPNFEILSHNDVRIALHKTQWRSFISNSSNRKIKIPFMPIFIGFIMLFNLILFSQFSEHLVPVEKRSVLAHNSANEDMSEQIDTGLDHIESQLTLITSNSNENIFHMLRIGEFLPEDLQVITFQVQGDSAQMNIISDDILAFVALLRTIDIVQAVRVDPIRRTSTGRETSNITLTLKIGDTK